MMKPPFDWRCPYCNQPQVVTQQNFDRKFHVLEVGKSTAGNVGVLTNAVRCVSPSCNELTLISYLAEASYVNGHGWSAGEIIRGWNLMPESFARPQPDYIPEALREDYEEACLIRDKSPKASATLARRCLQGMIRDFCGISRTRLIDEINELRGLVEAGTAPKGVESETVEAIDAIRGIGNIGAHMERDISLIIEVDPGEAQSLIELLELLFDEWYVARHTRDQKLARVRMIAAQKEAEVQAVRAQIEHQRRSERENTENDLPS